MLQNTLLEVDEGSLLRTKIRSLYNDNHVSVVAKQAERIMTTRTRRETVYFKHPFSLQGIDRLLPAGPYEVVTDDEMIEGLSFPCYRRVATMIMDADRSLVHGGDGNGVNQFGRSVRCAAQGRTFGLVILS